MKILLLTCFFITGFWFYYTSLSKYFNPYWKQGDCVENEEGTIYKILTVQDLNYEVSIVSINYLPLKYYEKSFYELNGLQKVHCK